MAANATNPAISGEFFIPRTSIGKANVDILVPSIEIDDPKTRVRKAWGFDGEARAVRECADHQAPARARLRGMAVMWPGPAAPSCSAGLSTDVSLTGANIPLRGAPQIVGNAGWRASHDGAAASGDKLTQLRRSPAGLSPYRVAAVLLHAPLEKTTAQRNGRTRRPPRLA